MQQLIENLKDGGVQLVDTPVLLCGSREILVKAYGCTVIGVDIDPEKTQLGLRRGCHAALVSGQDPIEQAVLTTLAACAAETSLRTRVSVFIGNVESA